jgi:hypothetical protein
VASVGFSVERAAQLQAEGRWLEAAALYNSLAVQDPRDHRLRANQGNALWLSDLPQAAARAYHQALSLKPDCGVSLRGLASCLRDLNRWSEAIATHSQAAARISPGSPEEGMNRWALSQVLLGEQRWREGFAAMAARHRSPHPEPLDLLQPALAVASEQGFGDTFQYLRFLPALQQRRQAAGRQGGLTLLVEPNLVPLLQEGLAWLQDPIDVQAAAAAGGGQLTLLDLPHHLGISTVTPAGGYLRSPLWPAGTRRGGPLRVGLCWAAGRKLEDPFTSREYHKRSLPPQVLSHLIEALHSRGARLVSLQVGPDADTADTLGVPLSEAPFPIESFSGTARVLRQLDRVVSVDTAIAHLAGAMGVPGWVLLPWSADPRWLASGESTPWYSSLRLFRQPNSGDWHGAIHHLLANWDRA